MKSRVILTNGESYEWGANVPVRYVAAMIHGEIAGRVETLYDADDLPKVGQVDRDNFIRLIRLIANWPVIENGLNGKIAAIKMVRAYAHNGGAGVDIGLKAAKEIVEAVMAGSDPCDDDDEIPF